MQGKHMSRNHRTSFRVCLDAEPISMPHGEEQGKKDNSESEVLSFAEPESM